MIPRPMLRASARGASWTLMVLGALVLLRFWPETRHVDRHAMMALGGAAEWAAAGGVVERLPRVAALAACLTSVVMLVDRVRLRALWCLVVLAVGNAGAAILKDLLAQLLPPGAATLPSGHAMLALTAAVPLLVLAPRGHGGDALRVAAGFLATVGTLGVVVVRWHVPGDSLTAAATAVLAGHGSARMVRLGRSWCPPPGRHRKRVPAIDEGIPAERTRCLVAAGAATAVVTILGWGFQPQTTSWSEWFLGVADLIVLTSAAVWAMTGAARVAGALDGPSH